MPHRTKEPINRLFDRTHVIWRSVDIFSVFPYNGISMVSQSELQSSFVVDSLDGNKTESVAVALPAYQNISFTAEHDH